MRSYLILRLAGPMQAWGQPTFEGTRPTGRFPTRSGLLGLLGACLGIQRDDTSSLQALSESVWICPYISRHLLSLNPLLACCRRYSRGER